MKKIVSIVAIISLVVFSYPQIVAYADAPIYELKTRTSTANYYDDSDLQSWSDSIISYGGTTPLIADIYSVLSSYTNTEGYTTQLITLTSNNRLLIYEFDMNVIDTLVFCRTSTDVKIYCYSNGSNSTPAIARTQEYRFDTSTWLDKYDLMYDYWHDGRYISFPTQRLATLWAGVPYYYNQQILTVNGTIADNGYAQNFIEHIQDDYVDFLSAALPYMDSDGNIQQGSGFVPELENNSNHMYFKSCDLGFCEPYGMNDFSNFGGAYLYCKYTVDDWVVNHINDYSLQFNVTSVIGQQQNNFSYTARLDRNGVVTVPFSSIFVSNSPSAIPKNNSFVACVSSKKLTDDYNIANLYTLSESNLTNWLNATKSYTTFSFSGLGWSVLQGKEIQYIVACINDAGTHSLNNGQNANTLVQINPYIFRVSVKLIDSEQNLSGEYAEKFDLFTGDKTTVNSDGLVNNDPFVPDIIPDDPESLPIIPDDNGNSTTPVTIINNGGSWSGTATISYDPDYRDLRDDVISSENDWGQYFYPFKQNNGVGDLVGSTLDAMPSELKVIFIGGFGVLTCFAIYRFIRRG